jgi:hypothetical protein
MNGMAKSKYVKAQVLADWCKLEPNQNPLPYMSAIPYKQAGSKYGEDGIRIDGSPEFIDAVLSCLKPLIAGESNLTRLELSRTEVQPREGKPFNGGECCYIRLHQRGSESQMLNMAFNLVGREPHMQFAEAATPRNAQHRDTALLSSIYAGDARALNHVMDNQ